MQCQRVLCLDVIYQSVQCLDVFVSQCVVSGCICESVCVVSGYICESACVVSGYICE